MEALRNIPRWLKYAFAFLMGGLVFTLASGLLKWYFLVSTNQLAFDTIDALKLKINADSLYDNATLTCASDGIDTLGPNLYRVKILVADHDAQDSFHVTMQQAGTDYHLRKVTKLNP